MAALGKSGLSKSEASVQQQIDPPSANLEKRKICGLLQRLRRGDQTLRTHAGREIPDQGRQCLSGTVICRKSSGVDGHLGLAGRPAPDRQPGPAGRFFQPAHRLRPEMRKLWILPGTPPHPQPAKAFPAAGSTLKKKAAGRFCCSNRIPGQGQMLFPCRVGRTRQGFPFPYDFDAGASGTLSPWQSRQLNCPVMPKSLEALKVAVGEYLPSCQALSSSTRR